MRPSVKLAVSALVIGGIGLSSVAVHGLWWRTATATSRGLAETINRQIATAVKNEVASLIGDAEAAWGAIRTIFIQNVIETKEADKREFVFLSQLQAQKQVSWVAFAWPDGNYFAAHKRGDSELEMMETSLEDGERKRRVDRYRVIPGDIEFKERFFEKTAFDARKLGWFADALKAESPDWVDAFEHPTGRIAALAYVGPIDVHLERQGVLAVMIELSRVSRFLGRLQAGATGAVYVLGADGHSIAAPDAAADELTPAAGREGPLFRVAELAGGELMRGGIAALGGGTRIEHEGKAYTVTLTPLGFRGWRVATVIPEAEFLGDIEATMTRLAWGLAGLVLVGALGSVWLARRFVADPLAAIVDDLRRVERFDVEQVPRRASRLAELADLSAATSAMAAGLSSFRRYLPTDVVRMLVAEGVAPVPGGQMRPVTVLFVDVAGFTGLSERIGEQIVVLMQRYFEAVSGAIAREGGTIDKFIGDAVMAFWGAPRADEDHAANACRAALGLVADVAAANILDDRGVPLRLRVGVNSGVALVGNIGSAERLNYTALGDAVNIASRLEGANKVYGSTILIGEETRRRAGAAIVAREIDTVALHGRADGIAVFELIGLDGPAPAWVARYEQGLAAWRARDFATAAAHFRAVSAEREDRPARLMLARSEAAAETDPGPDWRPVTVALEK